MANWKIHPATHHHIVVGDAVEVFAGLRVRELSDAEAVGRLETPHEEPAARLDDLGQLEEAGGGQEGLDGVLTQLNLA